MIVFRGKQKRENLMPEAIAYLESQGFDVNTVKKKDADKVSKLNSKSLVLMDFEQNEMGNFQFTVKDKAFYNYTQKLIKEIFAMKVLKVDPVKREITGEVKHKGICLDMIEVLASKYNLSLVV